MLLILGMKLSSISICTNVRKLTSTIEIWNPQPPMKDICTEFSQTLKNTGERPQLTSRQGETLMSEQRYEAAVLAFDQVVEAQPTSAIAWFNRADALAHLERYQEALSSIEQAVKINPDFYVAWTYRGVLLLHLGEPRAALLSCETALKINPQHHEAWVFRGAALQRLGRYQDAYASYDRAIGKKRQSTWQTIVNLLQNVKWHLKAT